MPNFTENLLKEFEKFTDISRTPLPLFQVAMLMQTLPESADTKTQGVLG